MGFMGLDTVGIGFWEENEVLIGCSISISSTTLKNEVGILGMGRGPTSIITLKGASFGHFFAYCLPRANSKGNQYFLGIIIFLVQC